MVRPPGRLPGGSVATRGRGGGQGSSSHRAPGSGSRAVAQGSWDRFQLPLEARDPNLQASWSVPRPRCEQGRDSSWGRGPGGSREAGGPSPCPVTGGQMDAQTDTKCASSPSPSQPSEEHPERPTGPAPNANIFPQFTCHHRRGPEMGPSPPFSWRVSVESRPWGGVGAHDGAGWESPGPRAPPPALPLPSPRPGLGLRGTQPA